MASTESECVEVDEPEIEQVDGRKNEETTWSVTNSRIVIDCYKDNAVLYDKSHKDYGRKAITKKVFAPVLAKMPDKTISEPPGELLSHTPGRHHLSSDCLSRLSLHEPGIISPVLSVNQGWRTIHISGTCISS